MEIEGGGWGDSRENEKKGGKKGGKNGKSVRMPEEWGCRLMWLT
jgi:hypothetical protein